MRGSIVFGHANGFPAPTYGLLFKAWRDAGWRVLAPEKLGHEPAYAVQSNWHRLRDELCDYVARACPDEAVHLVGHSMGGYLCLLAACRRPALARSVVLLDAPVLAGWRAHAVQAMKATGLMARVSPAGASARRRWQWPSADAAWRHFADKPAFARWAPEVLRDYLACGTEPDPDADAQGGTGVRLSFRRDIETRLYNTLPHDMGRVLRRHPPQCPVAFVGGSQSSEIQRAGLDATRALVHERLAWVEGSHLFPMERPLETAQAVLRLLP
jgi:pimeloyl-ACP methyl ester carboxylesterase